MKITFYWLGVYYKWIQKGTVGGGGCRTEDVQIYLQEKQRSRLSVQPVSFSVVHSRYQTLGGLYCRTVWGKGHGAASPSICSAEAKPEREDKCSIWDVSSCFTYHFKEQPLVWLNAIWETQNMMHIDYIITPHPIDSTPCLIFFVIVLQLSEIWTLCRAEIGKVVISQRRGHTDKIWCRSFSILNVLRVNGSHSFCACLSLITKCKWTVFSATVGARCKWNIKRTLSSFWE